MKYIAKQSSTSNKFRIFIQDLSNSFQGLTGLAHNSSGLTAYYLKDGDSSTTAITLASATLGTFTSGGFIVVDATNMPGMYEIGVPNAAFTALGNVLVYLQGASNMAPCILEIQVVAFDPTDAVHLGLSCLPNTAVTTNGSLITSGTGTAQLSLSGGIAQADVAKWLGTAPSTPTVAGVPNVNVKTWNDLTTVALPLVPTTAGRTLDVSAGGEAGVDWSNVGSQSTSVNLSATTVNLVNTTTTVTNTVGAQLANGVAHGGPTATLELGSASNSQSPFYVHSSGSGIPAVKFHKTGGSGSGLGLFADGVTGGVGLESYGSYGSSGAGAYFSGYAGIQIDGDNFGGIAINTTGTGSALYLAANGTGHDIKLDGDGLIWDGVNNRTARMDLTATGLDAVLVESGITAGATLVNDSGSQLTSINARQALALILAGPGLGGLISGAATTNPKATGTGAGTNQTRTRADVTADSNGNRTAVTLQVPD